MNATVEEWVAKAKGDLAVAGREMRVRHNRNHDAICFHAQQCIEKLMKGLLILHRQSPPKTHDLVLLDQLLAKVETAWSCPIEDLRFLTRAAVAYRYPGESADADDARRSLGFARHMSRQLMLLLKAPGLRP